MGFSDLPEMPRDLPPGFNSRDRDNLSIFLGLGMGLICCASVGDDDVTDVTLFFISHQVPVEIVVA
jgi:hypothetical protein